MAAHANYGTWSIDFVIKDPAEGPGSLFIECNFLIWIQWGINCEYNNKHVHTTTTS